MSRKSGLARRRGIRLVILRLRYAAHRRCGSHGLQEVGSALPAARN